MESANNFEVILEWVLMPILIFLARVADVSLGTLRMASIAQGLRKRAAIFGFFEVLIWIGAISYVLQNLTHFTNYLAYAGGYGTGNYIGLMIEEKLAAGLVKVTIITSRDATMLIENLKSRKFGITSVSAMGSKGHVRLVISIIPRKKYPELQKIIDEFNPKAFVEVQTIKQASRIYPNVTMNRKILDPGQTHK
jgi:uncharacterized protein YebE (UPF0316 family)